MCFSATASFTASAVLGAAGAASVKKAKKDALFLALIPLMFSVQQFLEGIVWLLPHPSFLGTTVGYGFLFFALLVWPSFIPYAMWRLEKDPSRKCDLRQLFFVGMLGSTYLFIILLTQPLHIEIIEQHIRYSIPIYFELSGIILYVALTVGALLLSTSKYVKLFGVVVLASALFSWQFYTFYFTSVWCFFAALLSLMIFFYFYSEKIRNW